MGVGPDYGAVDSPPVQQGHGDPRGLLDHVMVGENEPVGRENESGARADRAIVALARKTLDMDNRRTDFLGRPRNGLGIGVEQFTVRRRCISELLAAGVFGLVQHAA